MFKTLILLTSVLSGFAFGHQEAPTGEEWQSPQQLSLNKQYPHAWFFSFTDTEAARKVLPEGSSLWLSLNGDWKFNWSPDPDHRPADFYKPGFDDSKWDMIPVPSSWNVVGIQKDGSQKYGTPIYINTDVPYYVEVQKGDWRNGVMRTPPEDWTTFKTRNEVGSYRRSFTVPENWKDHKVYINFDGVDSFFYLWVNGSYVGFSKNSRNTASFDISSYLQSGENSLAVEVYRFSDASNLEVQDMFRLPGIFRTVALEAKPAVCIRDVKVTPTMNSLNVEAEISGAPASELSIDWSLYENELYSEENRVVSVFAAQAAKSVLSYPEAKAWSAEYPQVYTLVGQLKDASGRVLDIVSLQTGFRVVDIHDATAEESEFGIPGRYFFLNGRTVKLRGVNRHESEPSMGHAITREVMERDIMMMKQANINHVRNSHYTDDPYWYYLCDKYGIYLMDEANCESHHYRYGTASLSHEPEWKDAHVARMMEMVCANYNHPSIVIWSMGNEAGPGVNFKHVYDAARAFDAMRPVQYERNNDISDIGACQYPMVSWVQNVATGHGDVKYPFHINEFAHSMGNALGNFASYWKSMDSTEFFIGGAIWDWVDQSLWNWTPDGFRYLASGGEFGDIPNDGQFLMNGIIFGDRTLKPQYSEVKKVYQSLYTSLLPDGRIELFNRNYYESASYDASWTLLADGKPVCSGSFDTGIVGPRQRVSIDSPVSELPAGAECYLNIEYKEKKDLPWASAGFVSSREQLFLQAGVPEQKTACRPFRIRTRTEQDMLYVSGRRFKASFDMSEGVLHSLSYRRKEMICPGNGPKLNVMRAFINNDQWGIWNWLEAGLHQMDRKLLSQEVSTLEDGSVRICFRIESKAPNGARMDNNFNRMNYKITDHPELTDVITVTEDQVWTVHPDGSLSFNSSIDSDKPDFGLPRLGYIMQVPGKLDNFTYYGRGPVENYSDRYTSAFVGIWSSTVEEQDSGYTRPQDMSNHEQLRWLALTGRRGKGLMVVADTNSCNSSDSGLPVMSANVCHHSPEQLFSAYHPHLLPEAEDTWLCVDAKVSGVGGNSCGPAPLDEDIARPRAEFGFTISFLSTGFQHNPLKIKK